MSKEPNLGSKTRVPLVLGHPTATRGPGALRDERAHPAGDDIREHLLDLERLRGTDRGREIRLALQFALYRGERVGVRLHRLGVDAFLLRCGVDRVDESLVRVARVATDPRPA